LHRAAHIPTRFYLAIAGAILAVSTAAIFIKFAQQDAPSLVIAAFRLTLASLVLAPIALTRHSTELGRLDRKALGLGLLAGVFLALHFALWISSLEYTSVASSVVLVTTTPLWVALAAPFILKETLKRSAALGMGLALTGGVIVGLSDACHWYDSGPACPPFREFIQGQALQGNLLALGGAWMAAGYLLIGRHLREKLSLLPYIFVVYGMAALVLACLMLVSGASPFGYQPATYLWLLALALIPQLIGHSTFNWALRYVPASFVSIALLGEPIGSTILAYFLLHEVPGPLKVAGALLILAGIYAASLGQNKESAQEMAE
jgi:drug/metabolite transporter (DMT)-like permease